MNQKSNRMNERKGEARRSTPWLSENANWKWTSATIYGKNADAMVQTKLFMKRAEWIYYRNNSPTLKRRGPCAARGIISTFLTGRTVTDKVTTCNVLRQTPCFVQRFCYNPVKLLVSLTFHGHENAQCSDPLDRSTDRSAGTWSRTKMKKSSTLLCRDVSRNQSVSTTSEALYATGSRTLSNAGSKALHIDFLGA